ncbi:M43 family zinc metalloprotease [Lewinella sp. 4G2]|uniref:M43 family zinc metalloprotease n=1 Tax=Lewinella sp. 4G2 TaxID=1803372 RepID=UPI0007B4A410|nr:M43 family zinc metalloprotease [Lewinella sp. 4G2]OAV43269.1 hypothetical protein A3850_001605 [Lewinella sp. 4G2]
MNTFTYWFGTKASGRLLPLLLVALCSLHWNQLAGQNTEPDLLTGCITSQANQQLLDRYPDLKTEEAILEQAWQKSQRSPTATKSLMPAYTLPIVFHVVHNGGAENIPDADILRSLDFANQAFANQGYFDRGTGADTDIQFCLARRTPDNQPTSGITRTQSPLTSLTATDDELALKNLRRFDPTKYINVWVVDEICGLGFGCGVAGYAYYPSAHGREFDGIVVEARGLTGGEAGVTTLIHELGHYLGLAHTFDGGCKNDDCLQDGDRVCDTPPDASRAGVPCNGSANSCTTDTNSGFATDQDDHFYNYMDYGRQDCRHEFTPGQGDRMEFFLTGRRKSLLTSLACQVPCPAPITANFIGGDVTVEVGTTINFSSTGTNGDNFTWSVNETDEGSGTSFSRQFPVEGFFRLQLVVSSNDPLCGPDSLTQFVRVECTSQTSFGIPASIEVGQPATFTNTSSAVASETWTVDGVVASPTGRDLTFTFPTAGVYEICLAADFGFCAETRCRLVFVSRPPCVGPDCPFQEPGCTAPFAAQFERGDFGRSTLFSTVLHAPTGYYVGGNTSNGPYVAFFDLDLNQVWHTELYPERNWAPVREMILDDAGNLACLVTAGVPGSFVTHLFSVDGTTGDVNWAFNYSTASGRLGINTLVQPGPGQNYLLFGNINQTNVGLAGLSQGVVLRIDPATGGPLTTSQTLTGREYLDFRRARYDAASNRVYVATMERRANSINPTLACFNPDGSLVFTRRFVQDILDANIDVAITGNRVITMAETSMVNTGQTHLYGTNLDGQLLWVKRLPILFGYRAQSLKSTATGFLYLGARTLNLAFRDATLLRFDTDGQLLWGNVYENLYRTTTPLGRSLDAIGDQPLLVGNQLSGSGNTIPIMNLLREDGTVANDCLTNREYDPDILDVAVRMSVSQFQSQPLAVEREEFFWEPIGDLLSTVACRDTCPDDGDPGGPTDDDIEICDNDLDDDDDGLTDCDDPDLAFTCCCLPSQTLMLPQDSTLCDNVPVRLGVADSFAVYQWSTGETSDSVTVFAPGTYWLTATDSCGFVATDTITLHLRQRPDPVDLGPDQTVCDNGVVPLAAPPGYASYRWVDGTTERTFTAFAAGEYWVEATDSCGRIGRDTMRVITEPTTKIDLGPDTIICFGQELVFSLNGFNNYQWTSSTYLDCDDCPTVRFTPERDTMLFVAAELSRGCISTDSILVEVTDALPGARQEMTLCPGDSLFFDGANRGGAGTFIASTAADCTAPDTLALFVAPTPAVSTETTAQDCGGAAAGAGRVTIGPGAGLVDIRWANGATTNEVTNLPAGVYGVTVTNSAGCTTEDSIIVVPSRVPTLTLTAAAATCPGADDGSLVILGDSLGLEYQLAGGAVRMVPRFDSLAAGSYTLRAGIPNGCDTTYTVMIGEGQGYAFDLGPDRFVRLGDSVEVGPLGFVPDSLPYLLRTTFGDTCTNCPFLSVRPPATGAATVTAVDPSGCVIDAELQLIVDRKDLVYIPSAFSPNSDGNNDRFRIYPGPAVVAVESLEVYQRWGGRVFRSESNDPASDLASWDGRLDGKLMNPAVFIYRAQVRLFTGEVVSYTGDVVLMR